MGIILTCNDESSEDDDDVWRQQKNHPINIKKDIFFSDKICQFLGDKQSFIKIGSLRNFQELLQVSFPRECANMHSHSEMFTKGFFNLISGFETSTL